LKGDQKIKAARGFECHPERPFIENILFRAAAKRAIVTAQRRSLSEQATD